MDLKNYRNKAEMKQHKKPTLHLLEFLQMSDSLLAFFHLFLISVLFQAHASLTETKFTETFSLVVIKDHYSYIFHGMEPSHHCGCATSFAIRDF